MDTIIVLLEILMATKIIGIGILIFISHKKTQN